MPSQPNSKFTKLMQDHKIDYSADEKRKGLILKEVREEKKLSLAAVHEATKIPLDVLRAIEDGYSVRTLSPFYLRGFLKIYAAYLGIESSRIIDASPAVYTRKIEPRMEPTVDMMEEISKFMTKERQKQLAIGVGVIIAVFLIFKFVHFITNRPKSVKQEKESVNVVKKEKELKEVQEKITSKQTPTIIIPQESKKVTAVVEPPKTAPVSVEQKSSSAKVVKGVTLTVKAKDKSWLRVVADEGVVFQGTIKVGAVETWKANEKIIISGRNINKLEFELNGKIIGTLGRKDRQARELVITKDGLTVTK